MIPAIFVTVLVGVFAIFSYVTLYRENIRLQQDNRRLTSELFKLKYIERKND